MDSPKQKWMAKGAGRYLIKSLVVVEREDEDEEEKDEEEVEEEEVEEEEVEEEEEACRYINVR